MHFMDFWTEMPLPALVRLLFPAALLAFTAFLPGRGVARATALIIALYMPLLHELGPLWPARAVWALLWLGVAWRVGGAGRSVRSPTTRRLGGAESGTVGLMLCLVLLALLVAGVARQNLSASESRIASYGLLVMSLGLLHLMLRRDALRAGFSFAALGLGLQLLESVSRTALLEVARDRGHILIATATAVALADRIARVRQQDAGSGWVSDAHDLHD